MHYDIKNLNIWAEKPDGLQNQETEFNCDIEELRLPTRPYNALRRAGCNKIADLLQLMEDEKGTGFRNLRNLGATSEAQILAALQEFREQHGTRCRTQTNAQADAGKNLSKLVAPDGSQVIRRKDMRLNRNIWDSSIEDYHLSDYALNGLKEHGINCVKDLYATDPKNEPGWYAVRELFEKLPVPQY